MEPLASKLRPKTLEEFAGQQHLIGKDGPIRRFIEQQTIPSMIFWGPPGTGKTTLAYIISQNLFYDFYKLSAVNSGKDQLRSIIKIATQNQHYNKKTIMFLDEIHRWNKAQQDALLPYVEKGIITLIGATTENPSFSINGALLSRTKVFVFKSQEKDEIVKLLKNALKVELKQFKCAPKVIDFLADLANGDIRTAYNYLEMASYLGKSRGVDAKKKYTINLEDVEKAIQKQLYHDKAGDEHYNIISAIHKSLRSSNADAACYWIMRMLEAGDDPLYVARRLLRFAAEDIGMSDPNAVILANNVFETCQKLGMPECDVHLMMLAQYLAKAPKNNSAYVLSQATRQDVRNLGNLPVPIHLRNAPTQFMKDIGYGKGYQYDHDLESKKSDQQCMPDKLKDKKYL